MNIYAFRCLNVFNCMFMFREREQKFCGHVYKHNQDKVIITHKTTICTRIERLNQKKH